MENTRTKVEVMKPVLLKAGIPIAISVVGFIFAKLSTRKSSVSRALNSENVANSLTSNPCEESGDEESFHSLDSISFPSMEDEEQNIVIATTNSHREEEILGLTCRIEELQEREWKLEARFLHYCQMKEQEKVLMEIEKKLLLEMARVEFLGREISFMEADHRRFEELVVVILRLLEQLEIERLENGMLHKKVKKLSRRIEGMSCFIREQNMLIETREAEGLRNREELERKANDFNAIEDEIVGLQTVIDQLQQEKKELNYKLQLAENSASSKIDAEGIATDDHNQLVNELEQLQKDRAVEVSELIFLRWSNACLRHELARKNHQEQQEQVEERENHLELEIGGNGENGHSCLGHPKRPKLIQKIKRWVEGCEKMKEKSDDREKREGLEERQVPPRNSCSSA